MPDSAEMSRVKALERFRESLMAVQTLPAAPDIIRGIIVMTDRDDANIQSLATLVERDPSLAARILGLANSSFVTPRRRIATVAQAVVLLGFSQVRDIVLGVSLWGDLAAKAGLSEERQQALWQHSLLVAGAAKRLAEHVGQDGGQSFTAGLIHDIGKLVLGLRLGESYWAMVDDAAERGLSLAVVERDAFGCDHGMVGAWLLELWSLPPALVPPVARHHAALDLHPAAGTVAAVAVADRLVLASASNDTGVLAHALGQVQGFAPQWLTLEQWAATYAALSITTSAADSRRSTA